MNYLITGYTGFVAKNLIKNLRIKNNLTIISRKKIFEKGLKIIDLDLSKKQLSKKLIIKKKIDCVIHVASIKMNNKIKPEKIISKNLNITINLIKLLRINNFKKIINFSSSSLYPNIDGNFHEKKKINFINNTDYPYALSKYLTERMLDLNFQKRKILHMRIVQIIGNNNDKTIISNIKRDISNKNIIEIFGNGKRILNLIHIKKLIRYVKFATKSELHGIYNIGDYSLSLNKIAKIIKKKYGSESTNIILRNKLKINQKLFVSFKKFYSKMNLEKSKLKELVNEI